MVTGAVPVSNVSTWCQSSGLTSILRGGYEALNRHEAFSIAVVTPFDIARAKRWVLEGLGQVSYLTKLYDGVSFASSLFRFGLPSVKLYVTFAELHFAGDKGSRVTLIGLFANIGLTSAKGAAGFYMHSASLMADAAHSFSGEHCGPLRFPM